MKRHGHKQIGIELCRTRSRARQSVLSLAMLAAAAPVLSAHAGTPSDLLQKMQQLTDSMTRVQGQIQESQRQLDEMRQQLQLLQEQITQTQLKPQLQSTPDTAPSTSSPPSSQTAPETAKAVDQDLRERQAVLESQIETHEQSKVESESKYPVKVTGLILFNGFVNTSAVDIPSTPTVAVPGPGSTGATVSQTILGINAFGPHLFGASSYADLRVDFAGNPQSSGTATYTGFYSGNPTLLRLRTAHAELQWKRTEAFFSLDQPLVSPDSPTSLAAVAEPALAWSGNLWTWNPQVGVTQDLPASRAGILRLQGALIYVGDPPLSQPASLSSAGSISPTTAELSRWPGAEARIAIVGSGSGPQETGNHLGVGGYFAPHSSAFAGTYDSWAATLDTRLLLPRRFEITGSFYRGLALGGLGGGAFKDFAYRIDPDTNEYYSQPLNDVGGWSQLKEKLNEKIEFNAALGMDNVFASDLRPYAASGGSIYRNLARNHTYSANAIYSPSAYLLFSIEYRRLQSFPINGPASESNVIGLAAGYKF